MAARTKVRDSDPGFKVFLSGLKEISDATVEVGWFDGGEASKAVIHEFGAPDANIPPRPMLRPVADRDRTADITDLRKRLAETVGRRGAVRPALVGFATNKAAEVVRQIDSIHTPPLTPGTIKRKGSSKPLIDTGRMRAAVSWRVKSR